MKKTTALPMSAELVDDPDDLVRIRTCDDEAWLRTEFQQEHQAGLRSIRRMAAIVYRMKDLGMDLPHCSDVPYLLRIADGKLDAELFYVVRDQYLLLERAQTLLSEDQNKIARNEPFLVATIGGSHLMVPPLSMSKLQIQQVFANGRVRNETEQRAWLQERLDKEDARASRSTGPLVQVDKKRKGVTVTAPGFLTVKELLYYVEQLS
jgi:hypothetical protein